MRPTTRGSLPKRRAHSRWPSSTTLGPSGAVSAAVNVRPSAAFMPSTEKKPSVTTAIGSCSAGPSLVSAPVPFPHAARSIVRVVVFQSA